MRGRIIKGIGGFYYVYAEDGITYTCKAKGIFRKDRIKPLVGDRVDIDILQGEELTGSITSIFQRDNCLIRPNVANIDQALIIFALKSPDPNFVTLDKMILQYALQKIPVLICFNKEDLSDSESARKLMDEYADCGCSIFLTSAVNDEGIEALGKALEGRTTAVAGPSGAGKSTIVNSLCRSGVMATGEISEKLSRGKHTTRHSEIIPINADTFIMDTPGFSSFELFDMEPLDIGLCYNEFAAFNGCRFTPCSHTHEPGCVIKEAVEMNKISKLRYDNYVYIYEEAKSRTLKQWQH